MKNLKIFLVDDHNLFREGLKLLISKLDYVEQVFEAADGNTFINSLKDIKPDITFMDIEMPGMDGINTTKKALEIYPDLKIIALSMYAEEHYYSNMIDAGAKGFVLKNSRFEDINRAITDIYNDKGFFSPEILDAIISNLYKKKVEKTRTDLSEREIEILYNICKGFSNQQIADNLFLSKRTVDKHRENILLKTGSKNTANLVVYAIKNGIFEV